LAIYDSTFQGNQAIDNEGVSISEAVFRSFLEISSLQFPAVGHMEHFKRIIAL
jgi:hypothetical protein